MKKHYSVSLTRQLLRHGKKCAAAFLLGGFLLLPATAQAEDDFDMLMNKIRTEKLYVPATSTVSQYMTDMAENGSYSDVNYKATDRTNWPPLTHIDRLVLLVNAYVHPQSTYYGNEELYNKIVAGLQYWYDVNPVCQNWWYNQIAEPQRLGVIFILMKAGKQQIPEPLATNTITRWKKDGGNPAAQTGANRTDVALHYLYRGCVTKDASVLNSALNYIYDPMRYTTGEGFQVDNSYFQHGQQLYIGGYGDALLSGVLQVTNWTLGTKFQLDAKRTELLGKFVRETFTDVIRGTTSNFDCLGRGMSRIGALRKTGSWSTYVRRMRDLDTDHKSMYDAILKRINGEEGPEYEITPKHTHYFRGDYTLHMRPKYNFSVRTVSTRTCRNEYGNGENLKTYFLSDGCTDIARTGNEYYNLMPCWDWNRIPGTTAPRLATIPMASSDWQTKGTSTFTGGVSDSLYGATTYNYYDTYNNVNTGGKKGWFFFDDEVVCLGAGIKANARAFTTVEQCWGADTVRLGMKDGSVLGMNEEKNDKTYNNTLAWVLHNGVGYSFPAGGRLVMNNKMVSGKWTVINSTESNVTQTGKVFTLAVDHMIPSTGKGTYAYIVTPGMNEEQLKKYNENCPIEIAKNNDTAQVVHHKGLGVYEMIFYKKGEFKDDSIHVVVNRPCALVFKDLQNSRLTFHVADPGQTKNVIQVNVKTAALGYMRTGKADYTNVDAQYAGQTRTITLTPQSEVVGIESTTTDKDEPIQIITSPLAPRAGEPFGIYAKGAQEGRVEIVSTAGVLVTRAALNGGDVNLSLPTPGIYVVRVITPQGTQSAKVLVR